MRVTPAAVVATTALVIALSGTAVAATGGSFLLGHTNRTTSNTIISNSKGTALVFAAKKGIAPFSVNGDKVKVPSLNADLLDGVDSTKLQLRVSGQCGSTAISSISATGSVTCMSAHHLFFTSGTATFTVPAGVTQVELLARGGGGSGGASNTAATEGRGGGGGQGGVTTTLVSVTAGQVYTVNVGAGGTVGSAANGIAGGRSSVILTPSTDATKFAAVANGGGGGQGSVLCSSTSPATGGDGGSAPGPTGPGALGLTGSDGADGTTAGSSAGAGVCASGGTGGGAGYAGAGGDGGTPDATTPVAPKPGLAGLVEVTFVD